jgi:hypothetical protein
MLTSLCLGTHEEAVGHTRRQLDPAVHLKADERHAPRHYTGCYQHADEATMSKVMESPVRLVSRRTAGLPEKR